MTASEAPKAQLTLVADDVALGEAKSGCKYCGVDANVLAEELITLRRVYLRPLARVEFWGKDSGHSITTRENQRIDS